MKVTKQHIKLIQQLKNIFIKLKNDGVDWHILNGGSAGTLIFYKLSDKEKRELQIASDMPIRAKVFPYDELLEIHLNNGYDTGIVIDTIVP